MYLLPAKTLKMVASVSAVHYKERQGQDGNEQKKCWPYLSATP